jgi:hypothetical protein
MWPNRGAESKEEFDFVPSLYESKFRSLTAKAASPASQ